MILLAVSLKQIFMILGYIACYLMIGLTPFFIIRYVKRKNRKRYEERMKQNLCDNGCDNCNAKNCPNNPNN